MLFRGLAAQGRGRTLPAMTVSAGSRPAVRATTDRGDRGDRGGNRAGPAGRSRRSRIGAAVVVAAVLGATALGVLQLYRATQPVVDPDALQLDGVSYSVTHAEEVTGLSDADMSGMSGGIQGLVSDDQALIRVTLQVTAGDSDTVYDAGRLYVDEGTGGPPLAPVGGSLAPGGLGAGARIEGSLGFVVKRAGQHLTLHAPGSAVAVDLLTVDTAPPGSGQHEHEQPDPGADAGADPGVEPADPFGVPGGSDEPFVRVPEGTFGGQTAGPATGENR